ncbi:MAG: HAD-IIA family hydrolase [candidate division Zixibacteria bacterium]|nr:HAD-IIA family hydrolase [candidate division Zixibacteria bacterium]
MTAIILAAGRGTRLSEFTDTLPKCLVAVAGRSILEHQIKAYLGAGLVENQILVATGYRADMIADFLASHFPGVGIIENRDYATTNNMVSLSMALASLGEAPGEVLISNGDCVYDLDIVRELIAAEDPDRIAVDVGAYFDESMKVAVDGDRITDISKEVGRARALGASIDLYRFSAEAARLLFEITDNYITVQGEKNLWSEVAIRNLLDLTPIKPFDIRGRRWVEIDNLEDLRKGDLLFADFDLSAKKCLVVDLDGTVYLGQTPIDESIRFIKDNAGKIEFYFLTNNTSKTPDLYVKRLNAFGIATDLDHILSPYIPLIAYLKTKAFKRVFALGNDVFCSYLSGRLPDLQFTSGAADCEAVVVAYDTELTYEKLRRAALLLHNKQVPFVATHGDVVCPTEDGPIPDIGSILALLEKATGRSPDLVFGKPSASMLDVVRNRFATDEIAVVGDRLYTDGALAQNAGVDFILVLSGETKRSDLAGGGITPAVILDNLGRSG